MAPKNVLPSFPLAHVTQRLLPLNSTLLADVDDGDEGRGRRADCAPRPGRAREEKAQTFTDPREESASSQPQMDVGESVGISPMIGQSALELLLPRRLTGTRCDYFNQTYSSPIDGQPNKELRPMPAIM